MNNNQETNPVMTKIYNIGDKGKAACDKCGKFTPITYCLRDVPLSDSSYGIVDNILVGVCDICDSVITMPNQSTPQVKEKLSLIRETLEQPLSIKPITKESVTTDDYHYLVYQNPDKTGWIGICLEFPNLTINDSTSDKCLNRLISCIGNMIEVNDMMSSKVSFPKPIDNVYLTNLIESVSPKESSVVEYLKDCVTERQTIKHIIDDDITRMYPHVLERIIKNSWDCKKQLIHYLINWRKINNLSRLKASKLLGITKPEFYKITQSPYIRGTSYGSFDLEYLMNLVDKTKANITLTIN